MGRKHASSSKVGEERRNAYYPYFRDDEGKAGRGVNGFLGLLHARSTAAVRTQDSAPQTPPNRIFSLDARRERIRKVFLMLML